MQKLPRCTDSRCTAIPRRTATKKKIRRDIENKQNTNKFNNYGVCQFSPLDEGFKYFRRSTQTTTPICDLKTHGFEYVDPYAATFIVVIVLNVFSRQNM